MESAAISKEEKEEQHSLLLPSNEAKVLTALANYFSEFSTDLLRVRNGKMNPPDFNKKYQQNTKPFPKALKGLVRVVHQYYTSNIKKISPVQITNVKSKNNTLAITTAECMVHYCNNEPPRHCYFHSAFCIQECSNNWWDWDDVCPTL